jgi:hypothetical protein
MLVLSIAILTTATLGHAVSERIRLQNTADTAAYSMAAMEARAFNFYAFVNRTHVSHYVSAMVWQSYLSFIYFTEAFLTDVYGVFKTLNKCSGHRGFFWAAACPILERIPYVGAVISVLGRIASIYRAFLSAYQRTLRTLDPDRWIGRLIIPAHRQLNQSLTFVADAIMMSTLSHLVETSAQVVGQNDPSMESGSARLAAGLLTACLFDRAHFREANASPYSPSSPFRAISPSAINEDSKQARAKRVMGGIANATRFACDSQSGVCPRGFVTSRGLGDLLPLPNTLQPARILIDQIPKWGQTRLLTYSLAKGHEDRDGGNLIRHWRDPPNSPQGMMAQGDNLGADDLYSIKLGPSRLGSFRNPLACGENDNYWECWGDPRQGKGHDRSLPFRYMLKTSVWALNPSEHRGGEGGIHWRVSYPRWPPGRGQRDPSGDEAQVGLHQNSICVLPAGCIAGVGSIDVFVANVRPIEDGNHPWGGIVPFMHFEPGQYAQACPRKGTPSTTDAAARRDEFNQPSTWIALNKSPQRLRNPRPDPTGASRSPASVASSTGTLDLRGLGQGAGAILEMDDVRRPFAGLESTEGLNAISRGQVYYHRPGNWAEQPNFFNPYWRPRLASVYQGRASAPVLSRALDALPGPFEGMTQKVMTH